MQAELLPAIPIKEPRKQTCIWHCAACDSHHHSLGSFDAHREDGECNLQSLNKRGEPRLQVWTASGHCSLMKGCKKEGVVVKWATPVTIYQLSGTHWGSEGDEE